MKKGRFQDKKWILFEWIFIVLFNVCGVKWAPLKIELWYFIFNQYCPSNFTITDTESYLKIFKSQYLYLFFACDHNFYRFQINF